MKNLIKFFYIFILNFMVFQNFAFAEKMVLPKIINNKVFIGETVQKLIFKKLPDFKLFEINNFSKEIFEFKISHPMAITGDFNNDSLRDIVFYGYSNKNKKVYVIAAISIKKDNSFKLANLHQDEFTEDLLTKNFLYLNLGKKNEKIGLKRDIVQIETYQSGVGSVEPYYYSMNKKTMIPFVDKMD